MLTLIIYEGVHPFRYTHSRWSFFKKTRSYDKSFILVLNVIILLMGDEGKAAMMLSYYF